MQTDDGKSEDTVEHRVQGNIQFRRHRASGMAAGNVPGMLQSKAPYCDSGVFHGCFSVDLEEFVKDRSM